MVRADARSLADADRVAAEIRERFGALDVVFLNAGIVRSGPFGTFDEATFDDSYRSSPHPPPATSPARTSSSAAAPGSAGDLRPVGARRPRR